MSLLSRLMFMSANPRDLESTTFIVRSHRFEPQPLGKLAFRSYTVRIHKYELFSSCINCSLSSLKRESDRFLNSFTSDHWIMKVHLMHHVSVGDISKDEAEQVIGRFYSTSYVHNPEED